MNARRSQALGPDPGRVTNDSESALVIIEPGRELGLAGLLEVWRYRDLLYFLTWREISVRYKQTVLGILWAILQPAMTMIVFTVVLGRLARVPSDGVPYPIFSYLGLLPWTYFSSALTRCATSLVANSGLLTKVYFPRVLIPVSATLSALADFLVAFLLLIALMAFHGIRPSWSSLWLAPLVVLTTVAATGIGMWLSALNVQYRDIQYAIPVVIQLWMFVTPVVYPASLVPERWRLILALNPMTGIVEGYRSAVLGRPLDWTSLSVAVVVVAMATLLGSRRFRKMERIFADVV